MIKAHVYDTKGNKGKEIVLPKCFSEKVREDLVAKVLESQKVKQPYAPSLVAGKQHSASGIIIHRRHVWKNSYGKGMSRIPRKILSQRGTQFNWVGAEVSSTRGGRRAHPPKVVAMINTKKVNKKELKLALISALSASVDAKKVAKKYSRLNDEKLSHLPLIFESKVTEMKTKELLTELRKILGEKIYTVALPTKVVRSGIGKMRGRKYKSNAGMLVVTGAKEKMKCNAFEVSNVNELGVEKLADGGVGRLALYTEEAIKELGEKLK